MNASKEVSKEDVLPAADDLWSVNNPTGSNGLIGIDKLGDAICFFDVATLAVAKVIALRNHHEVAISPDRRRAFASEFGKFAGGRFVESGTHITVLDLQRREVVHRIDTGTCKGPHAMRFDKQGGMWVIFEETGELGLVDTGRLELVEAHAIGAAGARPPFIEITGAGDKIYVSCKAGNILVFDVERRSVVAEIAVPKGTEGIAISPDDRRVYAADNQRQHLLVIDTASDRIIEEIPLKGAVLSNPKTSRLIRLRFSPDGKYLVSTNYASGVMHIHDGADPASHVLVPIAKGPQGIAFDPGGRVALVANHDCGLITSIDLASATAIGCVEAGKGIEALTYY